MFILYNILQLVFLPAFFPLIILAFLFSPKYRDRIPARLGFGLSDKINSKPNSATTFWIHALSIGEVTSVLPLITGLRETYPESKIVLSVTTSGGKEVADDLLANLADSVIYGPFDFLPVVHHFIKIIQPDLFILVETDFWPNILLCLQKKSVPIILVNGRVSEEAMSGYRRMRLFFDPMFKSLSFLSMQTELDKENMVALGISAEKVHTLGNLKFETPAVTGNKDFGSFSTMLPEGKILFIAGSTHPGEEKILIDCYLEVKKRYPEIFLLLAPRDPNRSAEIKSLATDAGLTVYIRSDGQFSSADIFLIDTIGELVDFYAHSHIGFVGGSLVKKRGHNPIEPAAMGIPVVFGPNMQDFSEIAAQLVKSDGAAQVRSQNELTQFLMDLMESETKRTSMGQAALQCVQSRRGVITKHLKLISRLL